MPFRKLSKKLDQILDSQIDWLAEQTRTLSTGGQPYPPYAQASRPYYPGPQQPQFFLPQSTPPQFRPPQFNPPQPQQPQPYPQQSYPQQSYPQQSYPQQSYPPQPYPPQAYPPQSYPPQSYPQQPYPQQLYSPQPYPAQPQPQPPPPYVAQPDPPQPPQTQPPQTQSHQLQSYPPQPYSPQPYSPQPPSSQPLSPQPLSPQSLSPQALSPQPLSPQSHSPQSYFPQSNPPGSHPQSPVGQDAVGRGAPKLSANAVTSVALPVELPAELPAEPSTTNSIQLPPQRGLCAVCAQYEWEYHFNRYDDDRVATDQEMWSREVLANPSQAATLVAEGLSVQRSSYRGQFQVKQAQTKFTLQPYSTMFRNQESCSFCRLVVSAVESPQWPKDPEWKKRDTTSTLPVTCEIQQPKLELAGFLSTPTLSVSIHEPYTTSIQFQNINKALSKTAASYPHPNQADENALKTWWTRCQKSHGKECRSSKLGSGIHELGVLRLIDVLEQCVITAPTDTPYAALSYKWGLDPIYTASKNEMMNGRLSLKDKPIPRTIRDAMTLVAIVGERYLWVDALCIVQDDPSDVVHYIGHMDRIYKAAQFTIINASGENANSGLEGLQPNSRKLRLARANIDGVELIEQPKLVRLNKSSWAQRAWTYQEYIFSPRKFIFADGCVFYQCGHGISSEFFSQSLSRDSYQAAYLNPHLLNTNWLDVNTTGGELSDLSTGISMTVHSTPKDDAIPPLTYYVRNAVNYSERHATSQSDSLRAFQGILSHMTSTHSLTFCWGMPIPWFHMVLGWKVWSDEYRGFVNEVDEATLARYRATRYRWDRRPQNQQARAWFPSWSWASCDYPLDYIGAEITNSKSCIIWPWDAGYSLQGSPDPFTSGVLRIEAECAILSIQSLTRQYLGVFMDSAIVLDDLTLPTQESMKFARIADLVVKDGELAVQVIGLTESVERPGTYRRFCAAQLPASTWDAASSFREVIDLS